MLLPSMINLTHTASRREGSEEEVRCSVYEPGGGNSWVDISEA